jgi:hypothetical protein
VEVVVLHHRQELVLAVAAVAVVDMAQGFIGL